MSTTTTSGFVSSTLLDLVMPGMDGLSLFRRIKELHPDVPACFVTANTHGKIADEVVTSRAGLILAKPLDIPKLLYWIDGAVSRRIYPGHPNWGQSCPAID
jgi:CheY-like chemotaxis protein